MSNSEFSLALKTIEPTEIAVDLMTVIANKPTNCKGLGDFTDFTLWKTGWDYVKARDRKLDDAKIHLAIGRVERAFKSFHIDLVTLQGLKVPARRGESACDAYYRREKALQEIVEDLYGTHFHNSIVQKSNSKSPLEREIFLTWVLYLNEKIKTNNRVVTLHPARFREIYEKRFGKSLGPDMEIVKEVLVRGRLAYSVEEYSLCPLWLTTSIDWMEPYLETSVEKA